MNSCMILPLFRESTTSLRSTNTTLEQNDTIPDVQELPPLRVPPNGGLQSCSSRCSPNTFDELPCSNSSPPGLNPDGSPPKFLILLDCHSPSHVLLNDGDQGIQTTRPEGFECCEHASSEEDLRKTRLVLVRIVNCALKDK